jgi:hypothetical protein
MGTEGAFSISWDLEVEFERTSSQSSFIETVSFVIGLIFKEDVSFSFHKGVKELLEEMLDGKSLSWFSVWVKFFDNFFHGLFFDSVKGLPVHFLNLLHIFVWLRHNFNLTPDGYVYGRFYPGDTTLANMEVIKEYIKRRGLFVKLYVDKASHFKTTRHGGVHYEVSVEQKETQIGRALRELNIGIEFANSPQAKGKIERLFGFLQDRLIKELKLRGIKDYENANRFLEEEFWPWYNSRYGREAESVYRELPEGINLDLIFTVRERRKVNKDNTIRFKGEDYQLLPTNGFSRFAGKWVEVCKDTRGRMLIFLEGKELAYELIKERGDISKEDLEAKRVEEEVRGGVKQERWKPAEDHPWRRSFRLKKKTKDVTFQTGNYR